MTPVVATAPENILSVQDVKKYFDVREGLLAKKVGNVYAVDGVSFEIARGETLGLVGESGCGKSTVGRLVLRLLDLTAGEVHLKGVDISGLSRSEILPHRREMQMVFQDPYSSLNPKLSAGSLVSEPLTNFKQGSSAEIDQRVQMLFERVGFKREAMERYPHEFSGGQRQRLGIARALALNPSLIVADEPVSALDVSVQAQVINLLIDLQEEFNLALLFISHDLAVVEHVSHRIAVMYVGKLVEITDTRTLFKNPLHPYTQALLSAVPVPDPREKKEKVILKGDVASPINPPSGCRFHTRCPNVMGRCRSEDPGLEEVETGHRVACHLHAPAGLTPSLQR
ncbi:MAG: ATP-binding cassette domain-containing protein [Arenicellales bacterium]|jgi:peptide/nickel transport system ATP-binding protein/oligopeptide transport system ATP-binding protein|nr:ATP-binding cassette domain-containing protein [Arenicellales bacterium]|tara:strand:- start:177 stop:1196 length:1020 start_codon:yes stop_codon:yes gene_type:complete